MAPPLSLSLPPLRHWFVTPMGLLVAVLAVAATVVCIVTPAMSTVDAAWFALVPVGLVAYRWWFERRLTRGGPAAAAFAAHALACLGLVALHPLFGAYAFACYLDAPRALHGRARWLGVLAAACVLSFSQIGGLVGGWAGWREYLAFVGVNLVIATTMSRADDARDRANQRRVEAVEQLLAAERENVELQARLTEQAREAGVLAERARLSREIHDTVAQGLVGIVRQLEAIEPGSPEPQWRPRVDRATVAAREALAEARRAVAALASPRLDADDLPVALERLVTAWSAESGVASRFVVDGEPRGTAHDAVVLRLVQESLANVAHHARASRVAVSLTYADALRLDVRDDGLGFDPGAPTPGHGIAGMRARVAEVGGAIDVESAVGEGCTVSAEFAAPGAALGVADEDASSAGSGALASRRTVRR